jgi:hypothetical protein
VVADLPVVASAPKRLELHRIPNTSKALSGAPSHRCRATALVWRGTRTDFARYDANNLARALRRCIRFVRDAHFDHDDNSAP